MTTTNYCRVGLMSYVPSGAELKPQAGDPTQKMRYLGYFVDGANRLKIKLQIYRTAGNSFSLIYDLGEEPPSEENPCHVIVGGYEFWVLGVTDFQHDNDSNTLVIDLRKWK